MITVENLTTLLKYLGFTESNNVFQKAYSQGASIEVDFEAQTITYAPLDNNFQNGEYPTKDIPAKGFVIHRETTLDFKAKENFVCLVCVHLLLEKGYEAKHIVFEPAFEVGRVNKPSYGDILVFDKEYKPLVLIENKTYGSEFSHEWNNMQKSGGQLFSYLGPLVNELGFCENLVLFAADFEDKLILKNHIITLKDNEKRIADLENPKTFSNTQGQYFDVWSDTYAKSFETKGLFEKDIAAYSIGKLKYTIADLKELSHAEIRPIYHEFATILRNHAITDFEHSFYILIDLFLCKITDERNNPDNLQFYYKGITRDTPKEYCTRLLKLYQEGKRDLFHVEVVNKEESDIRQIFEDTNRTVTNGLFAGIKELFEEIKFYNIKKFNFIDVENKEDFEKNFQILIKIAALIQDINLSNSETNHFFGDLFEGLLSKNVHQTEGQFFTPLPIVNFIIKCLPEFPDVGSVKVLDYACGAGHFLTEFIKNYPNTKAFGIEKSQTLSQVAKIATIINGSKDARIVFKDSLSCLNTDEVRFQGFDKESFDCIIANPPYSVKGFLNTLTDNDRQQFDLIRFVEGKTYGANNSIECFFLERTKHFLRSNGFVGVVLPSSILSNGNLYTRTRKLLFSNFNILAIVSLNSRTFGSTGTNTIVLFAQRVKKNSEGLLHTFIEKKDYTQYLSCQAIDNYIQKQGYDKHAYFKFMQDDELEESLENHETFVDYKKNFKTTPIKRAIQIKWFKASSFSNNDLKETSKEFKKLFSVFCSSDEYKQCENAEYKRQFIAFAKDIECDKLNTFIQIESNQIAILQSPPDKIGNKSNKAQIVKFLGYDWSKRKGDEGIKYVTSKPIVEVDEEPCDKNDKDSEIVEAINSIKYIDTPLYNPNDAWDNSKFAFAIRKHIYEQCQKFSFGKNEKKIHSDFNGELIDLLSYAKLSDMVDFSRTEFDKSIKLTTNKRIGIVSKFPLEKLGNIVTIIRGVTFDKQSQSAEKTKNIVLTADNVTCDGRYEIVKELYVSDSVRFDSSKQLKKNDCFMCLSSGSRQHVGKIAFIEADQPYYAGGFMCILRTKTGDIMPKFLYETLNREKMREVIRSTSNGANIQNLSKKIEEVKIPLPPLVIQQQIVYECEKIDKEYNNSRMSVEENERKIAETFDALDKKAKTWVKLSDKSVFNISIGRRVEKTAVNPNHNIPVYSANVFEPFGMIDKLLINDFSKDSVLWGIDGDWMVNVIPANEPFYPTDHCGVLRIKTSNILPKYMAHLLEEEGKRAGFNRSYRASIGRIKSLSIQIASIEEQRNAISEIEICEQIITKAKETMAGCAVRKKHIMEKWLY